jgi:DnaK suppressor protein
MDENRARTLLTAERAEVAASLRGLDAEAESSRAPADIPGDFADAAEPLEAQATTDSIASNLRERLALIDQALVRLDAGTYGKSVLSGKPIPDERLEADPAAEFTVAEARTQR